MYVHYSNALCALFAFLPPSSTSCRQNYMQLLFCASASESVLSTIRKSYRKIARLLRQNSTVVAEEVDGEGYLNSSSFSRSRSSGLDLLEKATYKINMIDSRQREIESRMWRRQLLFVLAAAVCSWTLAAGEEVENANKMGRSEFPNSISSRLITFSTRGLVLLFTVNLFQIVT